MEGLIVMQAKIAAPPAKVKKAHWESTRSFLHRYRGQLIVLGMVGLWLLLFQLLKGVRPVMNWLAQWVTGPVKRLGAALTNWIPTSVSEIGIAVLAVLEIAAVVWVIRGKEKLIGRALTVLCAALIFYAGYVYLWGVNYYTDGFQERSGIYAQPPTVEQLYRTAGYFAEQLNEAGERVQRDENGLYAEDMAQVLADSQGLYDRISVEFPFLAGPDVRPKPLICSEALSWLNTTGFFCPWLGESNFNNHSPACDRPATIAHELAHQRGIASEQEANFIAVLVSTGSDSAAYQYSGWLLGYTYLNNALIQADPALWREVYGSLSPEVLADLEFIRQYWAAHDTAVGDAADAITDQRLKNYGQELGQRSYGAVVDLLVVYYEGA